MLALFYSRRIGLADGREVPIVGGGRVTGRVGPYAVGVLNVTTEDTERVRPGEASRTIDTANFTVVRVKRNILSQSNVGALFVNSNGGVSDSNRALDVDGGFFLGRNLTVTSLLARTQSAANTVEEGVRGVAQP